jgi:hypothetical protein
MLQRLLGHLHFFDNNGLHHLTSTKVGGAVADWHQAYDDYREVLRQLVQAFQKQDYVFVADLIEYEMSSCVSRFRSQLVKFGPVMLR